MIELYNEVRAMRLHNAMLFMLPKLTASFNPKQHVFCRTDEVPADYPSLSDVHGPQGGSFRKHEGGFAREPIKIFPQGHLWILYMILLELPDFCAIK